MNCIMIDMVPRKCSMLPTPWALKPLHLNFGTWNWGLDWKPLNCSKQGSSSWIVCRFVYVVGSNFCNLLFVFVYIFAGVFSLSVYNGKCFPSIFLSSTWLFPPLWQPPSFPSLFFLRISYCEVLLLQKHLIHFINLLQIQFWDATIIDFVGTIIVWGIITVSLLLFYYYYYAFIHFTT